VPVIGSRTCEKDSVGRSDSARRPFVGERLFFRSFEMTKRFELALLLFGSLAELIGWFLTAHHLHAIHQGIGLALSRPI